jgi:site-specific recombinase XerD
LVLNLETEKGNFTLDEYEHKLRKNNTAKLLFQFTDEIIANLKKIYKLGNAKVYQTVRNSIFEFINQLEKAKDISFSNLDVSFLNRFEQFLREKGLSENSMNNYFRTFRAIYNKAISEGYARQEEYPFDAFKISKFSTKTAKRALSLEEFLKIRDLKIPEDSPLYDAHLYFLFSFYTMGTNFVDMAKLEWKNVSGGRLRYKRTKTKKEYNLKLTQPALDILTYFKSISMSDYIFPILDKERHKTAQSITNRIHKVFSQYNKKLKDIVALAGLDAKVTSYVARHSSATIMKKQGISVEKIAELMGHDDVKTTQIYLDEFERDDLDEAMDVLVF